ncbi:hypothetical protein BJ165DRAFT_1447704 [Panaeolus papilionaceus]|nr:hypothetical protein BJ165DRAFT_1447704 [Panaeolus papilionaceus]
MATMQDRSTRRRNQLKARGKAKHVRNAKTNKWGGIHGYLFPSGGSFQKRKVSFSATHSGGPSNLPVLDVKPYFYNPRDKKLLVSTITFSSGLRYLVTGFYDHLLDPNPSLYAIEPDMRWKGAIAVVSMGTRSPLLSQPSGTQLFIRETVRIFMRRVTEAMKSGEEIPKHITCGLGNGA